MSSVNLNLGPVINDGSDISRQLGGFASNLKVGHCNAQSIKPALYSVKFDELSNFIRDSNLDIVAITETWLKPFVPDCAVEIPGYVFCRNDRPQRRGGGVGIYMSRTIQHRIISISSHYGQCETLFVEVILNQIVILIGVVYLPNGNVDIFESTVGNLFERYENIIVVGDFNNDLYDIQKSMRIRYLCQRSNISIRHNFLPTHFNVYQNTTSLLDYFLLSGKLSIVKTGQFQCPFLMSHHAFIYAVFQLPIVSNRNLGEYIEYRNYSLVDIGDLVSCVFEHDFTPFYNTIDVNCQASVLDNLISKMFSLVPLSRFKIKHKSMEWMRSGQIIYATSLREISYRAYVENPTRYNWRVFCKYRNKAKRTIRRVRQEYYGRVFDNVDSTEMWRRLRAAGNDEPKNETIDLDVNQVNNHFLDGLGSRSTNETTFRRTYLEESGGTFSFQCINNNELDAAFGKIKSNASGVDGIPLKFLKIIFPLISDYILHLFNSIITSSVFPEKWKLARVIPLRKSGTSYDIQNLRPISILPILSKVFEHVIKSQVVQHIEQFDLLNDRQTGYRRECSASFTLLGITESVRENSNRGETSILVSLDLSKAFDRVDHTNMLQKLRDEFRFSNTSCLFMKSYLTGRRQFVSFRGRESRVRNVDSGVAQGSVIGPLLFSMYLNNMFNVVGSEVCSVYAFADDIQLLFHGTHSVDQFRVIIRDTLKQIQSWMTSNQLILNVSKTKVMGFGSLNFGNIMIEIDGIELEFVDRMRILGVIIDKKLDYSYHVNNIYSKVCFTLRRLYCLNMYLPHHVRYKIAHALLMSQITYCLEVYICSTAGITNKIKLLINKIARFVFNIRRHIIVSSQNGDIFYSHISPYVKEFLKCSFENYLATRLLLNFYKIVRSGSPRFLVRRFNFLHSSRNTQLFIPLINNSFFEKSFIIRVAHLWNCLPTELRSFSYSVPLYHRKLVNYFGTSIET